MKSALVLAALTATAAASPMRVAWQTKATCPEPGHDILAMRDAFVWVAKDKLERRARTTGDALPAIKLEGKAPDRVVANDTLAIVRDRKGYAIWDVAAGKKLWRDNHVDGVPAFIGANLAVARGKTIELLEGTTGKSMWKAELGAGTFNRFAVGATLLFVLQG